MWASAVREIPGRTDMLRHHHIGAGQMAIRSYRDLDVWKQAIELGVDVYAISRRLPASERFGLCSQSQRAAVSIAANIAEGYGRRTRGEYAQFIGVARGSLRELDTLLHFMERLGYVSVEDLRPANARSDRIGAMLERLLQKLRRPPRTGD